MFLIVAYIVGTHLNYHDRFINAYVVGTHLNCLDHVKFSTSSSYINADYSISSTPPPPHPPSPIQKTKRQKLTFKSLL